MRGFLCYYFYKLGAGKNDKKIQSVPILLQRNIFTVKSISYKI